MFGPHLMLDCYGCNEERLGDVKFISNFIDELIKNLNMTKISGPHIIDYPGKTDSFDKGGVSIVTIIAESHITIHTFLSHGGYMNIDIFSCKEFDIEKTIDLIKRGFSPTKFEKRLIMRGEHFPRDVGRLKPLISVQREEIKL